MKKILTLLMGLMLTLSASAELFLYKYEGTRLTYKIIDEKERTCAVSLCSYVDGDVVIPEIAKDEDVAYRVIAIDNYAFSESGLKSIVIPESVTEIGHSAFESSYSLESVTLPSTITTIKYDTFNSCSSLTSITIPSSVTSLDEHAFYGCSDLSTVSLGESLKSIGKEAFAYCKSLKSIIIPSTVTQIEEGAFRGCESLSSISLPESLTEIKAEMFCGTGLTTISLPQSLKTIEQFAFAYSKLTTVTIPASVTSLSGEAFSNCSNLKAINVDPGNPNYESKDGILYYKGMKELITFPGALEECDIPSTVESIRDGAFQGCKNLETIVIPESVEEIGEGAFWQCDSLKSVEFKCNSSELTIGDYTFMDCKALQTINLPENLTSIGIRAFGSCCSLTTVYIPENVVSIEDSAFGNCSNLQTLTIPGKIKEIGEFAFYNLRNLKEVYYNTTEVLHLRDKTIFSKDFLHKATLYVAPGGLESAKSTSPWRYFGNIEEFDFSKADEIPADYDSMYATEIFTLDGKRVAGEAGSLAPGIYILRQGGKTKKIAVK